MNWLIYIGGWLFIYAFLPNRRSRVDAWSMIFGALAVWIWVCWRFVPR